MSNPAGLLRVLRALCVISDLSPPEAESAKLR
jgi:hypothetical protein